jgi:hypothetical protein
VAGFQSRFFGFDKFNLTPRDNLESLHLSLVLRKRSLTLLWPGNDKSSKIKVHPETFAINIAKRLTPRVSYRTVMSAIETENACNVNTKYVSPKTVLRKTDTRDTFLVF